MCTGTLKAWTDTTQLGLFSGLFLTHKNECSQFEIGLKGISMVMGFPQLVLDCSDAVFECQSQTHRLDVEGEVWHLYMIMSSVS